MTLGTNSCRQLLLENILSFWTERMMDMDSGGFYGRIDGSGRLHKGSPKAIILNARILWTFSAAFNQLGDSHYRSTADRAFKFIQQYFLDQEYGGVYWMLTAEGMALETKKQVYAQAFAIYALSEYHQATGSQQSLDMARELYRLVEHYSFDQRANGYLEAFDREWNLLDDLRLSEKDANEAKTMNTHLHLLEAYTNLYQCWPDPGLGKQLENLIELFLEKFIDENGHFHLFFDQQWNLKSSIHSYGHDIEGGWLLLTAAECLENGELIKKCQKAALMLTDAALSGLDNDGGLMYEGDGTGVIDTDKHWWPQAEALVGLVNAYQVSGKSEYLKLAEQCWDFITKNLVDESGEWHGIIDRAGNIDHAEDKAGPWKAPYHNGRAMLELMSRYSRLNV